MTKPKRNPEPSEDAPLDVADLPTFWDARDAALGKGPSVCAAELKRAIEAEGIGALTAVVHELAPRVAPPATACTCDVETTRTQQYWREDPACPEHGKPAAPPADDVRARDLITRMDHEAIVASLRAELALFRSKHTDRAACIELRRRARELSAELAEYRARHQLIAYATNVTRAHDALAELLGTEEA